MPKMPASLTRRARPVVRLLASTLVATGLLAGCGGGTDQVDRFEPKRLLVFGDELSVITNDGFKYSVNFIDTTGGRDCESNPIWIQHLAAQYNIVFAECNPDFQASPAGVMLAQAGATSSGLETQVAQFTALDSIRGSDMATVLVGMNDVLEAYRAYPAQTEDELVRRVEDAGTRVGARVNALAAAGARVLVSTVPDMGVTPFAKAEDDAFGNVRSRLLTRLSTSFNVSMRQVLINDGSKIGLILLDDLVRSAVKVPGAYRLRDVTNAVCSSAVSLPNCTTQTLISDANIQNFSTYMWADSLRFNVGIHQRLGDQARTRANNNPF